MKKIYQSLNDFFYLLYPHLCFACAQEAPPYGTSICVGCEISLPQTHFHKTVENPFTERFWGRVHLQTGTGMYLFAKESRVARLIHHFKYKGKKEIGIALGRRYGAQLQKEAHFQGIDAIVPVPLHWRRQQQRGFNQSEVFGIGLSEGMKRPCWKNCLIRTVHTGTQTKRSRADRLSNLENVFVVKRPKQLIGKHLLLVDDVLTTGATLEACANELLKLPDVKISMATLAVAINT